MSKNTYNGEQCGLCMYVFCYSVADGGFHENKNGLSIAGKQSWTSLTLKLEICF